MISWKNFLEKVIDDFTDKGFTFNHIVEMHIITIAKKMDMSYDFYIKHKMCALEWKLNAVINKSKNLINKFDRNWRHILNRKSENYCVWLWTYRFSKRINGDNEGFAVFFKRTWFYWQSK